MMSLQAWMDRHDKCDHDVAVAIGLSRPQVSRIRRGLTTASVATAKRLEALTGIKWFQFMDRPQERPKARNGRARRRRIRKEAA